MSIYAHHISRIVAVLVYIESHLEEKLSLEEMAGIAHISPFHFHRLFYAYVGETLAEYIKRLRLQHAAERLQFSDDAITDIALGSGYDNSSSFAKVFHQIMGTSPRAYRKLLRPKILSILQRTTPDPEKTQHFTPEYIQRKEQKILFIRRVGDYQESSFSAFHALIAFLKEQKVAKENIKTYYSIGHDSTHVVERAKCRFDACVSLRSTICPQGEVGCKTLPAGRYAVFSHRGPYAELESVFEDIFRYWYPNAQVELADAPSFCEHPDVGHASIPHTQHLTKLFIPVLP